MLKTFFRLTYRTVANWLRDKLNLPPERYQEIDKEQHDHAFTMAGIDSLQALSRLNERVQAFINEGRTLAEFRADFEKIASEEGLTYTGSASWRSKLVALTNAREAYGAGRYQQQTTPEMLRDRPYWQYRHGGSAEPRVLHLGWNGTVLPANSYWWQTHYAPNGYGCSCKIFTLSAADLKRMGKDTLDVPPQNGFYNYTDPVTKQSRLIPLGVDPGFDHIPGQKDRKRLYLELLGKLPDELRKFGEGLING